MIFGGNRTLGGYPTNHLAKKHVRPLPAHSLAFILGRTAFLFTTCGWETGSHFSRNPQRDLAVVFPEPPNP